MTPAALRIEPAMPVDLGELLNAQEIAALFYKGRVTTRWVRERMAELLPTKHVKVGRERAWYAGEVRAAIAANRGGA